MKRSSGIQEAFKIIAHSSAEDIEEMVMKATGDAEMDLKQLGVAVDGKKCLDFVSNLVRRIIYRLKYQDNTHLSQRRSLDVMLVRLQRLKDSPFLGVLVFGTGFGCGNVRLVIIQLLCPAQPMERLMDMLSTYFTLVLTIKSSSVMHKLSDSDVEPQSNHRP